MDTFSFVIHFGITLAHKRITLIRLITIHTSPNEDYWNFRRSRGFLKLNFLNESMKLKWNFQRDLVVVVSVCVCVCVCVAGGGGMFRDSYQKNRSTFLTANSSFRIVTFNTVIMYYLMSVSFA